MSDRALTKQKGSFFIHTIVAMRLQECLQNET